MNEAPPPTSLTPALYLVDGSSYLYRAYFAIRQQLTTHEGFPTAAIYGVTSMLWKVLRVKDPEFVAMIWDAKGPTFRHDLYPAYKANRPGMPDELSAQIPHVRDIVSALGISQLEASGYEADDIIATLVRKMSDRPILIVSGDKDLVQLVDSRVTIWDPMKDEILDLQTVRERFGLAPPQLLDVMALSGDTADNIPGVPGVGPKTAQKLIREFGTLDDLLANLDKLPKGKLRERLLENRDKIPLWRTLVRLADDIEVNLDPRTYLRNPPDQRRLRELFKKFEFTKFLKDMAPAQTISFEGYELIQSSSALRQWAERCQAASRVVVDTETTSEFPVQANLVGISLCVSPPAAAYIPIAHETDEPQVSRQDVRDILGPIFADPAIAKVGQNIKYDAIVLARHGMPLHGIEGDTMVASYLINPSRRQHNLGEISQEILGHRMISFQEVTSSQKRIKNFALVPLTLARDYSCEDVHVTALVRAVLWERLEDADLWRLFEEVEMPLVDVLARMEMAGILVDGQGLVSLSEEFARKLGTLEQDIYTLAGGPFNINSTRQVAELLFEKLNLPQIKKTKKKTGYSTDVEVLSALAEHHALPRLLLEYRNLAKLKSTYVDGLQRMINPETGRVHTSFNQTVTATGRLSSSDPNLQNIPVRTEEGRRIRALFVAGPGRVLLSADYSQIDLRVLAHYSGDEALLDAFSKGQDIHQRTAAEVYGVPPQLVTQEMRRAAKTVNFGIIYGMSPYGLAKSLGIAQTQAKQFIERYFDRYPGVKKYMEDIVREAHKQGYVTTLLGRRRFIPDIRSSTRTTREFAERTAINTPIQGSAADIIKLAMLRLDHELRQTESPAQILLQVHDELVLEMPEEAVEKTAQIVRRVMETVMDLKVPLTVTLGWGANWADLGGK